MRVPYDAQREDELRKVFKNDFPDWHVLVVQEEREDVTFECYGIPDLDEITIEDLKKSLNLK